MISAVKSEKYSQVKLNGEYLLKDLSFIENLSTSDKLGITVNPQNELHTLLHKKFSGWIEKFYGEKVSTSFNYLPSHIVFRYSDNKKETNLSIETPQGKTKISLDEINENNFYLFQPNFDENDINKTNYEFLFRLSIGLIQTNAKSSFKILLKLLKQPELKVAELLKEANFLLVPILIHEAIRQDIIHLLEEFLKRIIDDQQQDLFDQFDVMLLAFHKNNSKADLKEFKINLLKYAVNNFKNPEGHLLVSVRGLKPRTFSTKNLLI